MKLALCIAPLLFAAFSSAATVSASSTCQWGTSLSVGTISCSIGASYFPGPGASDSILLQDSFPVSPSSPFVLNMSASAFAGCDVSSITCPASAAGNGTLTETLSTPGPLRTGYAVFSTSNAGWNGYIDGFYGSWSVDLQAGGALRDIVDDCGGFLACNVGPITDPLWAFPIPVTLGTDLQLTAHIYVEAASDPYIGNVEGFGGGTIWMQFFDADGTPVPISGASVADTPEPATWSLTTLAVALLICRVRRSRKA